MERKTVYKVCSDLESRNSCQGHVQPVDCVQQGSFRLTSFAPAKGITSVNGNPGEKMGWTFLPSKTKKCLYMHIFESTCDVCCKS